jgi:GNAT superfamily N-acetyltransferase
MKNDLIIEPIKSSNFNEFLYLIDELAKYEKLKPPDDKAKIRLKKDGLSKNPKYEAYLAKKDDKYLGYAIFFMSYSSFIAKPILYLEDIFVLQKHRKKGIGQLLFKLVVSIAKKRDCCRIEWHVLNWNQLGIKFYEKNNAKQLSNWLFYRLSNDRFDDFL